MKRIGLSTALALAMAGSVSAVAVQAAEPPTEVLINVHPGKNPNIIDRDAKGSIPVMVFGSPKLDVKGIDPLSLTLGVVSFWRHSRVEISRSNEPVCETSCEIRDAGSPDGDSPDSLGPPDGYDDLICQFTNELALVAGGIQSLTLSGATHADDDGSTTPVVGSDFAIEPTVLEAIVRCCIVCEDNGSCSGCNGDIYSCDNFLMTCDGDVICNDCTGCAPPRIS